MTLFYAVRRDYEVKFCEGDYVVVAYIYSPCNNTEFPAVSTHVHHFRSNTSASRTLCLWLCRTQPLRSTVWRTELQAQVRLYRMNLQRLVSENHGLQHNACPAAMLTRR